jgi:hypothetical protein
MADSVFGIEKCRRKEQIPSEKTKIFCLLYNIMMQTLICKNFKNEI